MREKNTTIGLAAICNVDDENSTPMIVFCADRKVSGVFDFNSGTSKISELTKNSNIIQSSDDGLLSDAVITNVKRRLDYNKNMKIREIVEIVSEECVKMKQKKAEGEILQKYNFAIEKLKANADQVIKDAIREIQFYDYPNFEFLVCGLDDEGIEAHIYKINQDGNANCWDMTGFAAVGAGEGLAFFGMTKFSYSRNHSLSYCVPRVYFAKKISQHATGVGEETDFGIMYFATGAPDDEYLVKTTTPFESPDFKKKLDNAFLKIENFEVKTISTVKKIIDEMMKSDDETNKENIESKTT